MRKGKRCWDCKKWKPFAEFFKNHTYKDKHQKYCKRCARKYQEKWRRTKNGKARIHIAAIKHRMGASEEWHMTKLKKQRRRCAICGRKSKRRLAVDHKHKTGMLRGLLCGKCNWGIGLFDENINSLRAAIRYLQYYDRRLSGKRK